MTTIKSVHCHHHAVQYVASYILSKVLKVKNQRSNQNCEYFFCLFCSWRKIRLLTSFIPRGWGVLQWAPFCSNRRALTLIITFFFFSYTTFVPHSAITGLAAFFSIWHALLLPTLTQSTQKEPPAITHGRHFSTPYDHILLWHKWINYHFYTCFEKRFSTLVCLIEVLLLCNPKMWKVTISGYDNPKCGYNFLWSCIICMSVKIYSMRHNMNKVIMLNRFLEGCRLSMCLKDLEAQSIL